MIAIDLVRKFDKKAAIARIKGEILYIKVVESFTFFDKAIVNSLGMKEKKNEET